MAGINSKHSLGLSAAIAAMIVSSPTVHAAVLTIGGVPDLTSGMVSGRPGITSSDNFDQYGASCTYDQSLGDNGMGQTGNFHIGSDSAVGVRGAPMGDTTCYASVGFGTGSFSTAGFFSTPLNLSYLGFYWGSADDFNTLTFLGPKSAPITITAGSFTGTTISGADLVAAFGLAGALGSAPSVFVNFDFSAGENPVQILFGSVTNTAFEFDNLAAIGTAPAAAAAAFGANFARRAVAVSEPLGVSLFGFGLLAIAARRRVSIG